MTNHQPVKNPLSEFFRQPKIFLRLPSKGRFYPQDSLDKSESNEYPVFSMTAKDELIIRTPDALMNGQSTVEVIKSCIPSILNPWNMPSIDVDACLIAMRVATYGESIDVDSYCPKCNHHNEYEFNLVHYLDSVSNFDFNDTIESDPLVIKIKPYSYKELTQLSIKTFEQQRILKIVNDKTISNEEKTAAFNDSFIRLTEITVGIIAGSIVSIQTPTLVVTDRSQIKEFIENAPKEIFNKVATRVDEMKNLLDLKLDQVSCQNCNHTFKVNITLDQSNFFAVRS
jgi:hypothetical protein